MVLIIWPKLAHTVSPASYPTKDMCMQLKANEWLDHAANGTVYYIFLLCMLCIIQLGLFKLGISPGFVVASVPYEARSEVPLSSPQPQRELERYIWLAMYTACHMALSLTNLPQLEKYWSFPMTSARGVLYIFKFLKEYFYFSLVW